MGGVNPLLTLHCRENSLRHIEIHLGETMSKFYNTEMFEFLNSICNSKVFGSKAILQYVQLQNILSFNKAVDTKNVLLHSSVEHEKFQVSTAPIHQNIYKGKNTSIMCKLKCTNIIQCTGIKPATLLCATLVFLGLISCLIHKERGKNVVLYSKLFQDCQTQKAWVV